MITETCLYCSNCDRVAAGYWYCKIYKCKVSTNTSCDGRFHPDHLDPDYEAYKHACLGTTIY